VSDTESEFDVAIIGGGAAGLATAVFLSQQRPSLRVVILDGANRLGAKILISGGGRCNVTNTRVVAKDFYGARSGAVKKILKSFSARDAVKWFEKLGVPVHEEVRGKLFPDSNKARTVVDALLNAAHSGGVEVRTEWRVDAIEHEENLYRISSEDRSLTARFVVLATGGQSVPKTGSDGFGYQLAERLGHTVTTRFPALVPLLLEGDFHGALSGVSHEVELTMRVAGEKPYRVNGSMLWTHFGISGPAALDFSRHWIAADRESDCVNVTMSFMPQMNRQSVDAEILKRLQQGPTLPLRRQFPELPLRLVDALLEECEIDGTTTGANITKVARQRLVTQLTERPLAISENRGFRYAEVTAGGIPLTEVDARTMQSRHQVGLYFVGEILGIDGRLGGFNFQWAWSSAHVAARGIAGAISVDEYQ